MPYRRMTLGVAFLVLSSIGAYAQRGQQWAFRDGEWATLAFEVPETSDQSFYLGCDKEKRRLSLSVRFALKGVKPGKSVTIAFKGSNGQASLNGRTETDELYPFVFPSAEGFEPGSLLAILAGPGDVTVSAGGRSLTLPAAGRAKVVDAFRASCPVK